MKKTESLKKNQPFNNEHHRNTFSNEHCLFKKQIYKFNIQGLLFT